MPILVGLCPGEVRTSPALPWRSVLDCPPVHPNLHRRRPRPQRPNPRQRRLV